MPEQSAWRDFKTYPPTSKVETTDALGLQGTKTFEQVVVPQSTDIKALPPISFSFFDPDQKQLSHPDPASLPLVVRPGGAALAPRSRPIARAVARQDNPPPAQDIVHIKPRLGALAQVGPPLVQQPWFLALQAFRCWRGYRRSSGADAPSSSPTILACAASGRSRKSSARAWPSCGSLPPRTNPTSSSPRLSDCLQEQLGERLDLPASAITEAVIDEHLRPRGVPETTLRRLHELFQTCNLVRYAPMKRARNWPRSFPSSRPCCAN